MEQKPLRYLLTSLVVLAAIQMQAQAQQLPRLVVCITVDQLRSDYLQELEPLMEQEGLRRLLSQGRVYPEVKFPLTAPDAASATATIFTGTYPETHGIERSSIFVRKIGRSQSIFWDEAYLGNYTRETYSPRALLVNTLGDRLKEASDGEALVYGIAPEAEQALSSTGILADGAFWIDNKVGAWASSSFYGLMPKYIERYNRSEEGLNKRLTTDKLSWTPLRHHITPSIAYGDWGRSFSYTYQGSDIYPLKQSPLINEEVTSLALKLIEEGGYERRKSPGLLSLSYTASPTNGSELGAEEVDSYLRLDREIARLLRGLDRRFGLGNCLITLSGTGYTTSVQKPPRASKLRRAFGLGRASALVNMYLSALYGQGAWVETLLEGRIYLNHKLAEQRGIALADLQRETASVLRQMEGVASATTADRLRQADGLSGEKLRLRRSVHNRQMADVYWRILPAWQIEELQRSPRLNAYSTAISSPFIIMGAGVHPKAFDYPVVEARDIVRAICSVLRIRPPNEAY